jgi:uncharacterized damage-inducible protein DinB
MTTTLEPLREQLARVLDWEEAHVGFSKTMANIPADKRAARPEGFEHTLWQLLEHLRIALHDLADFALNPQYAHALKWPEDYWPNSDSPSDREWVESIAGYRAALAQLQSVARDTSIDLFSPVPTGKKTQTYLRTILLAIDHNAYHVGQIVTLRRALGIWP